MVLYDAINNHVLEIETKNYVRLINVFYYNIMSLVPLCQHTIYRNRKASNICVHKMTKNIYLHEYSSC